MSELLKHDVGKSAVKSISPQVPVLPPKSTQIQPSSSLVLPASAPVQTKSTDEPVSASAAEFTRIWSFRDFTFKTTIRKQPLENRRVHKIPHSRQFSFVHFSRNRLLLGVELMCACAVSTSAIMKLECN